MPNLVDELILTVDEIRASIFPDLGVRGYSFTRVLRTWDGGEVGDGSATFASELAITPPPLVEWSERRDRLENGRTEQARLKVSEVSLRYTEDQLTGGKPLAAGQECYYRLVETQNQAQATSYWILENTPEPDRMNLDIGWTMRLRRYETSEA